MDELHKPICGCLGCLMDFKPTQFATGEDGLCDKCRDIGCETSKYATEFLRDIKRVRNNV